MATGSDVRDILEIESEGQDFITKDALFNDKNKKKPKKTDVQFKKPEGMHRELWGLIYSDNKDLPPMIPSDTNQGYKQMKAKIGQSRVRPWKWMPFTNPARKDGAVFYHWRRTADEGQEYPFARFNKQVDMPVYSDLEYQQHLHDDSWSRHETDYLFDMAKRFDLRFVVMHDRWDWQKYGHKRSIEDLKERFYHIRNLLTKLRAPSGSDPKLRVYDAEHERRRKEQLTKLFSRSQEQIDEEDYLLAELKKIEQRKKEREKKTQDLQKLITAADSNSEARRSDRKGALKKKLPQQQHRHAAAIEKNINPETTGIKFPDFKASGVTLRSQRMKLPASVGQKKLKAIEQVLEELDLESNPIPTEQTVAHFNDLRTDIVLLYELKLAAANCEYELQTLRHRFETLAPGKMADLEPLISSATAPTTSSLLRSVPTTPGPSTPAPGSFTPAPTALTPTPGAGPSGVGAGIKEEVLSPKKLADTIDIMGGLPGTPGGEEVKKKRKAALEQSNVLKKLKQKM